MKTDFQSLVCRILAAFIMILAVVACGIAEATDSGRASTPSQSGFTWKALWVHTERLESQAEIERMAQRARDMGFNVVIAAPGADMVRAVREQGMQFYAWVICLKGLAPSDFYQTHPGYLQKIAPDEESLLAQPRINPDRENVHPGPWLCPDYGLLDVERQALEKLAQRYPLDGVALDNVGYRNYHACFCQYSETLRAEHAKRRPTLNRGQVLRDFSEQALVRYVRQVGDALQRIKPALKLAIHVHPDFDLNPLFGNKLDIDYCGETIAWHCRPFWSYSKIATRTRLFLEAEGDYQADNRFVPFIGVLPGPSQKSPDRLRTEIRIAARAGTGTIMIAFYEALAECPDLAAVVEQELQ